MRTPPEGAFLHDERVLRGLTIQVCPCSTEFEGTSLFRGGGVPISGGGRTRQASGSETGPAGQTDRRRRSQAIRVRGKQRGKNRIVLGWGTLAFSVLTMNYSICVAGFRSDDIASHIRTKGRIMRTLPVSRGNY